MATIENFLLKFKVEGQQAIDGASTSVKNLGTQVSGLSGGLGRLVGGLGGVVGIAGVAGGAFAALGMKAVALAGDLSDISGATGIAAGTLMNFRQSVIEAGGKADDFAQIAAKLNQSVQEAAGGNETFQKSFQKLGVFVTDANGKVRDTESILRDVVARFQSGEMSSQQYAAAIDILGKNISKLELAKLTALRDPVADADIKRLDQYNDAIDKIRARLEKGLVSFFGSVAEQAEKAFSKMEQASARFQERELERNRKGIVTRYGPRGEPYESTMTDKEKAAFARKEFEDRQARLMAPAAGVPRGRTQEAIDAAAAAAAGRKPGFGATPEATLKAFEDSRNRITQSGIETNKLLELRAANDIQKIEIAAKYEALKATAEIKNKERLSDVQKAEEIAAKEKEIFAKRDNDVAQARAALNAKIFSEEESQREENRKAIADQEDAYAKGSKTALERADAYARSVEELQAQLDLEDRLRGLNQIQAGTQRKIAEEIKRRTDAIRELEDVENLAYEERLKREAAITQASERAIELIKKQGDAEYERSRSFEFAWEEAYKKYAENAYNAAEQARSYFDTFTRGFEDAIVKFVQTGKLSFKDLANTIIAEFARIQAKQLAAGLFGGGGGGGGFLASLLPSIFGNKFTPGSSSFVGPMQPSGGGGGLFGGKIIPGFLAAGGPAYAGNPYIIGEKGPELFVPKSSGTVIPNGQLGGSTMQNLTTVNYNIQAVDASSFRSLVARDPQFIYSVTERGRRSQPTRSR
jgi:lambda family phage tail tape measure protein